MLKVSSIFQESFKGIPRKIERSFKVVSVVSRVFERSHREFQRSFKGVSRKFDNCFKVIFRKVQGYLKEIKMKFQGNF